ncbi:hypothetical protein MSAN_00018200 [Mycena sanguinolenta]|uniref:Yeast cell wall synthesis Kre9/Knh1-like N-terminal domain-containing protein n=1 Tax=Mycena sanguinolenta TaxID=230812 RepID=A0A8H6ZEH6_9AGAR|nr:hypothetical protein MSAN_00018200 [Mycena sanguinolenta]
MLQSLDRLARTTQAIRDTASCSLPPSPFTRAVLETSLGDLVREIEPAELGLFTPQLARVEFHGPAPRKNKKQDPEVYAQAAYTYIDRYSSIRPMPRAYAQVVGILDQLAETRENISTLTDTLDQIQPSELQPLIEQEEQRVHDLQARLADLKQRKEAVSIQPKPRKRLLRQKPAPAPETPSTPVQSSSKLDETFYTPAAAARTLRFTDNLLMDEQVDLADVSITSPVAPRMQARSSVVDEFKEEIGGEEVVEQSTGESVDEPPDDDPTVVLPKPAVIPRPVSAPASPVPPAPTPATPVQTPKKGKVRVNTEVERIVAKIWSSAGDLIMPGHRFDTSGTGNGSKPPLAKETMHAFPLHILLPLMFLYSAHLQTIAALTPTPASPSTTISSLTAPAPTAPTPQQILTAHLLLSLLNTGPQFSMPLNKVKESLAAKASTSGGAGNVLGGQSTTRVLYGCVAKRLVKIERGAGEQIFIQPQSGSTCTGGTPCVLEWDDDGILPLLPEIGIVTAGLYTGEQQLVQSIPPLNVADVNSITFTPLAQAGPNSGSYYIAFTSTTAKENGTEYIGFSPFFKLEGMSGSFSSPLASATTTFSIPASLTHTGTIIPTTITIGNVDTSLPPVSSPSSTSSKLQSSSSSSTLRFTTSAAPSSSTASASPSVTDSGAVTNSSSSAAASRPLSLPALAVLSLSALVFTSVS